MTIPWQSCSLTEGVALSDHAMDVWRLDLEHPPWTLEEALSLLDAAECQRADRYRHPRTRQQFVFTRAALRQCLGMYLQRDPATLTLHYLPQGKPILQDCPLAFNVSHSGSLALLAMGKVSTTGVDLEYFEPRPHALRLAQRFFAPAEYKALCQLPVQIQEQAFLTTWTRKEAWVKAQAGGIGGQFNRFAVTVDPRIPPALCLAKTDMKIRLSWCLSDLFPAPGYVAALAYPAPIREIRTFKMAR